MTVGFVFLAPLTIGRGSKIVIHSTAIDLFAYEYSGGLRSLSTHLGAANVVLPIYQLSRRDFCE